jgi:hypothetical protein
MACYLLYPRLPWRRHSSETTKERGATILMPTSMVDSMNPVVALALAGQETAPQKANGPLSSNIRSLFQMECWMVVRHYMLLS